MNSAATAPSQNRARKLRGLLLALLALDDDAAGVVLSSVRDERRRFDDPKTSVVDGVEVTTYDPYDNAPGDVWQEAKRTNALRNSASSEPVVLDASPLAATERAGFSLIRQRNALGSTVPHMERAIERMREERPDLYVRLSSADDEVVAWLSDALTGLPINCPRWARSNDQ